MAQNLSLSISQCVKTRQSVLSSFHGADMSGRAGLCAGDGLFETTLIEGPLEIIDGPGQHGLDHIIGRRILTENDHRDANRTCSHNSDDPGNLFIHKFIIN